ncbi:hypothetical protein [Alteromonas sp. a30]|uniref:hypothetical protein n=1 Tax=Alteromonas sp. a30 TaxID=2730917 RepID=UPI0022817FEF|nr:hypothetical protein [Alteromonas sp. a30]MCY7295034.1 hypothetical protein [Alteromonas sp. a30]
MTLEWNRNLKPIGFALIFLCIVFGIEVAAIFALNHGNFTFSLDDPYIHLALAENIFKGHYGVNLSEFSAPSSSIIWPFILAPFASLSIAPYLLLFMNVVAACATLVLIWRTWFKNTVSETTGKHLPILVLLIACIPALNLVGLAFTGMEHSYQLWFSLMIVSGLIYEVQNKRVTWWLIAAIILAPLIRYECLALSGPALLFLFLRGYRLQSVFAGFIIAISVIGFALFLMSLGLNPFPTSIMAKSSVVSSGGGLGTLISNLNRSLSTDRGILLVLGMLYFLFVSLDKTRENGVRLLSATLFLSCGLHAVVGRYGWYDRYEIYIWASMLLTIVFLNLEALDKLSKKLGKFWATTWIGFGTLTICSSYILTGLSTPLAANNIYEQQYQMHRFVSEFYQEPVAVNDLGYVAYHNDKYVLDLWGLASVEALKLRQSQQQASWMAEIASKRHVKLVMLYEDWFQDIPTQWKKLGELTLGGRRVTVSRPSVAFYITDCEFETSAQNALTEYIKTLPPKVSFTLTEPRCEVR